jgi:hypothetical protein
MVYISLLHTSLGTPYILWSTCGVLRYSSVTPYLSLLTPYLLLRYSVLTPYPLRTYGVPKEYLGSGEEFQEILLISQKWFESSWNYIQT